MSINSCYDDISKFNNIKSNLENVVSSLNLAAGSCSPISNTIMSVYNVNDNGTPIVVNSNKLHKDIVETAKYIKNTVIPSIDSAIQGRRNQIEKLEEQARQEAEKKRKEEEEKRQKEAEKKEKKKK